MVNSFLALTRVFFQFVLVLALASLFPILATALPDASKDGIDKVKTWSKSRLTKAEEEFSKSKGERFDSPKFWGEEIIYQIQVDRFNNGDIHNDDFNLSPVQIREIKSGHLFGIINYRHGGDLQGVIQRLDYLKDLGIT
ncbi:MAG: hypothetical protein KDD35_07900, partial [Bdellovibrionales bacterium]|nr:hypothetical protein [Bdellovibrionales bacterium]